MPRMCVRAISIVFLVLCFELGSTADSKTKMRDTEMVKNDKMEFVYPDDLNIGQFNKQNLMFHHHHHHHNPDFHYHHQGPDFVIPEESEEKFETEAEIYNNYNNRSRQIPLDYIKNLNQFNVSDLLLNFVEGDEPGEVQNRFGDDDAQERSAATLPKAADCIPELRTVKIASSNDPSVLFIPQCTRVEQCGGCCKHTLLSCQPLKKEGIPFKVYKTQYTGEKKLKFLGSEVIMVEKHTKCKCQCRVKPEDCTKFQEYRESECGCVCVNFDEKRKCLKQTDLKLWNSELCTCQCKNVMQCSTGSYFDNIQCKCVAEGKRGTGFQRRSFRSEIVPLDEN